MASRDTWIYRLLYRVQQSLPELGANTVSAVDDSSGTNVDSWGSGCTGELSSWIHVVS